MIITLKNGNDLVSGEFSINVPPAPFMSHEPITYVQVDDEGNTYILDAQTNHYIHIPKSDWELDSTSEDDVKNKNPEKKTLFVEVLEVFDDVQKLSNEDITDNLTIKQVIFPTLS